MKEPSKLIREARRGAGLTQVELGDRMGTTQTAVARMERPGSNPTISTLRKALHATGSELGLSATPLEPQVDEPQLAAYLRMTPAERVQHHEAGYRNVGQLLRAARVRE